jgi:iron complex outermembrane receptor protein
MKMPQSAVFKLSAITSAVLLMAAMNQNAIAQNTSDVGTINITGQGEIGGGYMIQDDGFKNRSTVTKEAIDTVRSTTNPYQVLSILPSVNTYSQDATGLFGGNLRVRGFNSDQMGFTINGAPVNDSGNFAVYPQEYTDSENLCEVFITQGSVDNDAPHVGASGGNVGMNSCGPKDTLGGKFTQSLGQLGFTKTFIRLDSGKLGTDNPLKFFISASHAQADKFKGPGSAYRDHVDAGLEWKLSTGTKLTANVLYNYAVNNNIATLTKAQYTANPSMDNSTTVPQHLSGGASESTNFSTAAAADGSKFNTYYGYSLNPFKNTLFTSKLSSRIDDKLTLSAEPYYWFGYGTGGVEQKTLSTVGSFSGSSIGGGIVNPYGGGTQTVGIYSGSVTKTQRPGITLKADWDLEDHKVLAGIWYEKANHRQTGPATTVDNQGNISDLWLMNGYVNYQNGTPYEARNYVTISTGTSYFLQDTFKVNKELDLFAGVRYATIKRDFTNYASSQTGGGMDYSIDATYQKLLPSVGARYKLDDSNQLYANMTQNMRAPSNFVLSGLVAGTVTYTNGVATSALALNPVTVKEETSTNYEAGYRHFGKDVNVSLAAFYVDFKDRIAQSYNPDTNTYADYNVGNSTVTGIEFQAGTKPMNGFSAFTSATYTNSLLKSDFNTLNGSTKTTLATNGMQFPDTPQWMFAVSGQYSKGPVMAQLIGKYTGMRYTTLMNDESLDAYFTLDLNAGYRFENTAFLKNPTVRLNWSNILNTGYLLANSGSGSSISATANPANSAIKGYGVPSYYVGAPSFASVSFSTEF